MSNIRIKDNSSASEGQNRSQLLSLFKESPIVESEILANLPLFLKRQDLSQLLFLNEIYQRILNVHGVIFEFGVRWGRNLATLEGLRGIYEPYNHNRKIFGFDTFEGFPSVHEKDGSGEIIRKGSYSVTSNYEAFLDSVLSCHERESPISQIKKFELKKGDATEELEKFLTSRPETIVSFAYFDFDIYEPTKRCLELVRHHLTKGSVIGFDELNVQDYPGETLAVREVLGLDRCQIVHSKFSPTQSYLVWEGCSLP